MQAQERCNFSTDGYLTNFLVCTWESSKESLRCPCYHAFGNEVAYRLTLSPSGICAKQKEYLLPLFQPGSYDPKCQLLQAVKRLKDTLSWRQKEKPHKKVCKKCVSLPRAHYMHVVCLPCCICILPPNGYGHLIAIQCWGIVNNLCNETSSWKLFKRCPHKIVQYKKLRISHMANERPDTNELPPRAPVISS